VRFQSTEANGEAVLEQTKANGNVTKRNIIKQSHPTVPLAAFHNRLDSQIRHKGAPKKFLDNVLSIVKEIKQQNLKLDQTTYYAILTAYSRNKDQDGIMRTLKEMKGNGLIPSVDNYNLVLEALANSGNVKQQSILKEEMKENNRPLTTASYFHLLRGMCKQDELEFALDTLEEMKKTNVQANLSCYATIINASLRLSDAPTAFTVLKEAENAGLPIQSQPRLYMDAMRVGANSDSEEIVDYCWNKAIGTYSMRPDEGTLLNVLRVAAKTGNTKLATDTIRQLSTSGYPYKEHYFTPLMEAFIVKGDLKSAFNVLDIMRVSGVSPTLRATLPIRKQLDKDIEAIDKAYYILEELKKENKVVDISAFNVVVAACADAKDLERTIATYREASALGVQPNVDTYNLVIEACIQTRMKGMGNVVIEEMKKAEIAPNLETYAKMMELSCTQKNYEDAFVYLEEMKSYDIVPPENCYVRLAQKLAFEQDPRFHMVLEEMETFGYKVTPRIRELYGKSK
jgi:pentatricopeptide repeat protein